jgi:hypothetical protein
MSMTRRGFLVRVAQAGGSVYGAMLTLGLLRCRQRGRFRWPGRWQGRG